MWLGFSYKGIWSSILTKFTFLLRKGHKDDNIKNSIKILKYLKYTTTSANWNKTINTTVYSNLRQHFRTKTSTTTMLLSNKTKHNNIVRPNKTLSPHDLTKHCLVRPSTLESRTHDLICLAVAQFAFYISNVYILILRRASFILYRNICES